MTAIGAVFLDALGGRADTLQRPLAAYLRAPEAQQTWAGRFSRAGSPLGVVVALARPFAGPEALLTRYERDVPFDVELRTQTDADGRQVLHTVRRFGFRAGDQTLTDALSATVEPGVLRSRLGAAGRFEVSFACDVSGEGALVLSVRDAALRIGRVRIPLLRGIRPEIVVRDGWDDARRRRTIDMTARHPLFGTVLEYRGWLTPVR